jgi:hypothetical protein
MDDGIAKSARISKIAQNKSILAILAVLAMQDCELWL